MPSKGSSGAGSYWANPAFKGYHVSWFNNGPVVQPAIHATKDDTHSHYGTMSRKETRKDGGGTTVYFVSDCGDCKPAYDAFMKIVERQGNTEAREAIGNILSER